MQNELLLRTDLTTTSARFAGSTKSSHRQHRDDPTPRTHTRTHIVQENKTKKIPSQPKLLTPPSRLYADISRYKLSPRRATVFVNWRLAVVVTRGKGQVLIFTGFEGMDEVSVEIQGRKAEHWDEDTIATAAKMEGKVRAHINVLMAKWKKTNNEGKYFSICTSIVDRA